MVVTPSSSAVVANSPTAFSLSNGAGANATRPSFANSAFASSAAWAGSVGTSSGASP